MQTARALPPELTIYTVGELYPQCLRWIGADTSEGADEDCLEVDAAAVTEADGAGVQLLIALSNALTRQQRTLRLAEPSATLVQACTTLGVTHLVVGAEALTETTS